MPVKVGMKYYCSDLVAFYSHFSSRTRCVGRVDALICPCIYEWKTGDASLSYSPRLPAIAVDCPPAQEARCGPGGGQVSTQFLPAQLFPPREVCVLTCSSYGALKKNFKKAM